MALAGRETLEEFPEDFGKRPWVLSSTGLAPRDQTAGLSQLVEALGVTSARVRQLLKDRAATGASRVRTSATGIEPVL
jgi:hypothetical protein